MRTTSDTYNYEHFDWALEDGAYELWRDEAPALGAIAPDFELADIERRHHRLSDSRGGPVVVEFGSYTCPIFCGHIPAMERLSAAHPEATFLVVYAREAHPGEVTPSHRREADKQEAARRLATEEPMARTVLVDDLDGSVHRSYGGVWDSIFVLDASGRVVLRRAWNDPDQVGVVLDQLANGAVEPMESVDMCPPTNPEGFGHGLLRGGQAALLDFYRSAPPPVRQRLEASESQAVRAVLTAMGTVHA